MTRSKCYLVYAVVVYAAAVVFARDDRIGYNGQDLFLNGTNIAWVRFAEDIGPGRTDLDKFADIFSDVYANGGNALRFWLHTNGMNTPEFSGSIVTGPGQGAVLDLKAILDLAREHEVGLVLCLWSFDMLRKSNGAEATGRALELLTSPASVQSYVTNALIPMVQELKGHRAVIAWEIFNEPEGMSDEFGWNFNLHVPMRNIQRFVNLCAGAIHRTDPDALVTNGSWAFKAQTDVDGNMNYYSDRRLMEAGGDSLGTLDFYQVHYYSWAGTALSPFHHPASYWQLDKPILVGEFFANEDIFGVSSGQLYVNLYDNGYAGALSWSYHDLAQQPSMLAGMIGGMQTLWNGHRADVALFMPAGTILAFKAVPDAVPRGELSLLSWKTSKGSAVTLDGTTVPETGFNKLKPSKTAGYTLVARGSVTDTAEAFIRVLPAGTILSFSADPETIGEGESSILSWTTVRGSSVRLDGKGVDRNGSKTVKPAQNTRYTLTAKGAVADAKTTAVFVVQPLEINRALNRTATASSVEGGLAPAGPGFAVDGDMKTRWCSAWDGDQWLTVDLGRKIDVRRVVLHWESAFAKGYSIKVSDDMRQWTDIYATSDGDGGKDDLTGLSGSGRYIRLEAKTRATRWGFSLWEFQVFSQPAVQPK
jgi:hypothetical protein